MTTCIRKYGVKVMNVRMFCLTIIFCLSLLIPDFLCSCSSIDCPVQNTVRTYYKICNSDGTDLTIADALTVMSKRSDGSDTILFNLGTGISEFSLPVSYSHPEDILVFVYSSNAGDEIYATDTVWIKKDDIPHFESVDCNAAFFHRLQEVRYTCNFIDSIVIKEPSVTYDQTQVHFILYPDTVH